MEAESVTFNLGNTKSFEVTAVAAPLPEGFRYTNNDEHLNYHDLNVVNKIDDNINSCSKQVTEREQFVYDYINKNEFRHNNTNVMLDDLLNLSPKNNKITTLHK